ncbi:MAG: YggS family pyridoxal phosphate-dependent enzyme [Chlamydiota bacterium]|nr:YggS family pyridoxal phosphate-dependent enzyme [Chlamydiota bacterium]
MTVTDNYLTLRSHIDEIANRCGRDSNEITLVSVSKRFPWNHAQPAYDAGCKVFGENNVQEALDKMLIAPEDVEWHLIGSLQRKKVNKVVGKFSLIHSVDSVALAEKIALRSKDLGVTTHILLQVNVSGEESKHGFTEMDLFDNLEYLKGLNGVSIDGLMTMAPFTDDSTIIRQSFKGLRVCLEKANALLPEGLRMNQLSMGMSHDYAIAIEEGATLLRIGSAIFGERK